jgi:hypothetical protein
MGMYIVALGAGTTKLSLSSRPDPSTEEDKLLLTGSIPPAVLAFPVAIKAVPAVLDIDKLSMPLGCCLIHEDQDSATARAEEDGADTAVNHLASRGVGEH